MTLDRARAEIQKALVSIMQRPDCRLAQAALGRCVEHLACRDAACIPEVLEALGDAHSMLLGRDRVSDPMAAIRRAVGHLQTINEKAPLERGRVA